MAEKRTRPASSFEQLSPERMHELAVMGGKAAAAARKRKKGLREALLRLMEEDGVQERLAEALVREATEERGEGVRGDPRHDRREARKAGEAGVESKVRGSVGTERGRTVGAAAMR